MAKAELETDEKKLSFEDALRGLEKAAEALKSEETTLEDAIRHYEEGVRFYECCSEILNAAKQKIQVFEESSETLADF
ncbi:exodeoxyribonuclease VII small subunit [Bacilliculturomica massiliensis]|uniref:exodeoxyribonuclease VII small subunit n=1 Tax=Bacilliculturomica massiliensis TaxID=1917867 RepID=UPI00102FE752|nr:exodeoxyribonuclease VII small subunit [Bacilliculturomica massiliensis]